MTVLGPVPADRLGRTVMHEHVLIDCTGSWAPPEDPEERALAEEPFDIRKIGIIRRRPFMSRDNLQVLDLDVAISELTAFQKLGGGTLVDATNADLGQRPEGLAAAAKATGVNIVAGCGHYIFRAHPESLEHESVEAIADRLVREITEGIGGSEVKAGIIGELGTSCPLHPREEKVLRAAARAQQQTGRSITIHTDPSARDGHRVLDVLEDAGADISRVIMGHIDVTLGHIDSDFEGIMAYHESLAKRGCFVEYDTIGVEMYIPATAERRAFWFPHDLSRAQGLAWMIERGYVDQLLLSQDVCTKRDLLEYGGFSYGHILRSFCTNLADLGVTSSQIDTMLIENPKRALTLAGAPNQ